MSAKSSPPPSDVEMGEMPKPAENASKELPQFYQDDVVCMVDEDGNELDGYGIILETAWDSENEQDDEAEEENAPGESAEDEVGASNKKKKSKNTDDDSEDDEDDDSDDDEDDEDDEDDDEDDDDEDDDEDDEDEDDKLAPGYVRVAWPDRVEEELHHSCLRVVDRSFLHGDVVVKKSDPQGQIGTVIDVQVLADVTFEAVNGGADEINLAQVSTKKLRTPHPFIIGNYASSGAMLGLVNDCMVDIDVAFGPNVHQPKAVCTVRQPVPSVYKPQLANAEEVHEDDVGCGVYFPGLKLKAAHNAWKRATWITGKHDSATAAGDIGTVIRVRPVEVHVEWVSGDSEEVGHEHDAILKPEEVKLLNIFDDARWQVGDRCMLEPQALTEEKATVLAQHTTDDQERKEGETAASSSSSSSSSFSSKAKKSKKTPPVRDWSKAFEFAGTITRTYTSIRVQWQDGTVTEELVPATDFLSRKHLLENDFLPEDFAVVSPSARLVTVLKVDSKERMIQVRYLSKRHRQFEEGQWWEANDIEDENDELAPASAAQPRQPPPAEDVPRASPPPSADAIAQPPATQSSAESTPSVVPSNDNPLVFVPPVRPPESLDENDTKDEGHVEWVSVFDLRTNPAFEFCVGGTCVRVPGTADDEASRSLPVDSRMGHPCQVFAIKNGQITVVWADQTQSALEPDQLLIVEHDDEEEEEDEDEDDEDEDYDEYLGDGDEDAEGEDEAEAPVQPDDIPDEWISPSSSAASSSTPKAANGTNAGGLGSVPPSADAVASTASSSAGVDSAVSSMARMSLASSAVALATSAHPTLPHVEQAAARAGYSYGTFDIIEVPESNGPSSGSASAPAALLLHHKYESVPYAPLNAKAFSKRVRDEWKLLEKNLPPGIHVITYDHRIDLLKLMIVGNSGSPHYLNIFQFDLQLPPSYPEEPPTVHFHSRGNRMNPNLYLNGNVCLSLLNTWKSSLPSQRWDPTNSNLLQVFISLQGLVIGCAEPYYLEAGYEKQIGQSLACLNSHLYNETALIASLQHLASYCNAPLQAHPFVNVVLEHGLNKEVRERLFELNRLAREWELEKKAQLEAFEQTVDPSSPTSESQTDSTTTSSSSSSAASSSSLDHSTLYAALARFSISPGNEVAPANNDPGAPVSSQSPASFYHPSLGFVTSLVKQTNSLVKTLNKLQAMNSAAAK